MPWRALIVTSMVAVFSALGDARAWSQMIVHAMTGTIRSFSATQLNVHLQRIQADVFLNAENPRLRSSSLERRLLSSFGGDV